MSQAARGLKRIHELNIELRGVEDQIERGPKRIHAREQRVTKKNDEISTAEQKLTDLKLSASEKNSELQAKENKIQELTGKLNTATTNVEYDTFRRQIEADTAAKEVLEVEILECLERVDHQQIAIQKLKEELKTAESELQKAKDEVAATEAGLQEQAGEIRTVLESAEKDLPGEILQRYRRLVKNFGPDALAVLDGKSCSECFTTLAPQDVVNVNVGKYFFCRACGRLLYRAPSEIDD